MLRNPGCPNLLEYKGHDLIKKISPFLITIRSRLGDVILVPKFGAKEGELIALWNLKIRKENFTELSHDFGLTLS